MQSMSLKEVREWLNAFDKDCPDPQGEVLEVRGKMEMALRDAEKLRVLFFGNTCQVSMGDVMGYYSKLRAMWVPSDKPTPPQQTLH